jgi:hypothetical protein
MRFAGMALALLLVSLAAGCASMSNRPTSDMVGEMIKQERKVLTLNSSIAPERLVDEMERFARVCIGGDINTSGIATAGPGIYVPVSTTIHQRVDRGVAADGSLWIALRMDSLLHVIAYGVHLRTLDDGTTEAKVFPADRRKADEIKQLLEGGGLFCHWKRLNYPYD